MRTSLVLPAVLIAVVILALAALFVSARPVAGSVERVSIMSGY